MTAAHQPSSSTTRGNLLGILALGFYLLFTFLPDSSTLMVAWPWVLFWQVGWLCPVLWLWGQLWQQKARWLGGGWDVWAGGLAIALFIAALFAPTPNPARWYGWVALCGLAALYGLHSWLRPPERQRWLLQFQGYLGLCFIVWSLLLWTFQTFIPEMNRAAALMQAAGTNLAFDLSEIRLRNWAPFGHQNYVAGYLVLMLPLLVGLGLWQSGWRRWLWWGGAGVGLLTLNATASRGGVAGLVVALVALGALLAVKQVISRRWFGAIAGGALLLGALVVATNNRLQQLVLGLLSGQTNAGELAYRIITVVTGWHMGQAHWLTGVGPGGVLFHFQRYRPAWAGREAELAFQLHNTPAQIWAELGIWGLALMVGAIALLGWLLLRWVRATATDLPVILHSSVFAALLGYGVVSLTDYQLDIPAIAGTLIFYLAVLLAAQNVQIADAAAASPPAIPKLGQWPVTAIAALSGLGLTLAMLVWLVPVHRAWMLSSQGFGALAQEQYDTFTAALTQAHQLAPWEPYYPYQLGWNLGDRATRAATPTDRDALVTEGIPWFERAIAISPDREFGHSNLGWMVLRRDPTQAMQHFSEATRLVPAKRGVFFALGISFLRQNRTPDAIAAFALEFLRDPINLTSPQWRLPELALVYPKVLAQVDQLASAGLANANPESPLARDLRQVRGTLRWWQGDLAGAQADWQPPPGSLQAVFLDLVAGQSVEAAVDQLPDSAEKLTFLAWLNPELRAPRLRAAWVLANQAAPPEPLLQQLVATMNQSQSFDQWLKVNAPALNYRRERAGFGVLSRHIDGPQPEDFLVVVENMPIVRLLPSLLPNPVYAPALDRFLQPYRDEIRRAIAPPAL